MTRASELAERRQALEAERCLRKYSRFFRSTWSVHEPSTPLVWSWAYEATCDHLQTLALDWFKRQADPSYVQPYRNLLITKPPGFLKSRLLAGLVPWIWTWAPSLRAIALSCNPRVSVRDSMIARDIIASRFYQETFRPDWTVRDDADAKGLFVNSKGGWRAAMGWSAKVIGERGDLIQVDDPHDPDEVGSDALREGVHERWDWTLSNRVNDLGTSIRVGIAQRTHEDDWSARRIAEGWAHLDFPMLYETDRECTTPLGSPDRRTVDGECLDPVRFPPEVIDAERSKGERRWQTLYQGRPTARGGNMVKLEWLRYWRRKGMPDAPGARPKGSWTGPSIEVDSNTLGKVTIAADLAGGKRTERGDYNVIVALARRDASLVVLDVWRQRADFPEVQRAFRSFAARYPGAAMFVEQAASGAPLVASLQQELPGLVAVPTGQLGKTERLEAVLHFYEAGNIHFDEHATYLDAVVTELTSYPNAPHDDFVDAMSLAIAKAGGTIDTRAQWQAATRALKAVLRGGPIRRPSRPDQAAEQPPHKTNADRLVELESRETSGRKLAAHERHLLKRLRERRDLRAQQPQGETDGPDPANSVAES